MRGGSGGIGWGREMKSVTERVGYQRDEWTIHRSCCLASVAGCRAKGLEGRGCSSGSWSATLRPVASLDRWSAPTSRGLRGVRQTINVRAVVATDIISKIANQPDVQTPQTRRASERYIPPQTCPCNNDSNVYLMNAAKTTRGGSRPTMKCSNLSQDCRPET